MSNKTRRANRSYIQCPGCLRKKRIRQACPSCAFLEEEHLAENYIPYCTQLNEQYIIGHPLKKGPRSIIYKGFYLSSSQKMKVVALKEYFPVSFAERGGKGLVCPRTSLEKDFYEGLIFFQQEAEILRMLDHQHILRYHGSVKTNGTFYIVTDFCGDESLEDICSKSPFDEKRATTVILPILDALEALHTQGIIHCDVNPSNIHLKSQDHPVLLDFGSARFLDHTRNSHRPLTLNPGYSAPEQHSQKIDDYKPWTDVYACAATLYQLTTGKRLPAADLRRSRDISLPVVHTSEFSDALTHALSLDPYDRPTSIAEFRSNLKKSSISPSATIYHPGPHTAQGKRVQQFVLDHLPLFMILAAFLAAALFIYSARDPGPFPEQTEATLLVKPADYYILRDASLSIDFRYYDIVESILSASLRTEESTDGADYTSYAHFASWATNGTSLLQPAVRGDIIAESKRQLERWDPPDEFLLRTNFSVIFNQILSAIQLSRAGAKESNRAAIVAIITDGIHDPFGNRPECLNITEDQSYFFDDLTKQSFERLSREPNVHILMLLLGGRPECARGIEQKWAELVRTLSSSNRLRIISLDGYTQRRDLNDALLRESLEVAINSALKDIRRSPFIALRPAFDILQDDQRERLDSGDEFYIDFIFQPHLIDGIKLNIYRASLVDTKGTAVTSLYITSKNKFRFFSEGSPRNGDEYKETLVFKIADNFEPDPDDSYKIRLAVEPEATRIAHVLAERDITIQPSARSRINREKTRKLLVLTGISGIISIIFSASLLIYWRQRRHPRHNRLRRILRNTFIRPLRYWIMGFFALGSLVLLTIGTMFSSASLAFFMWLFGIVAFILLFLKSQELTRNGTLEQLSWIHILLSCVDSIFVPFLSALLSISQLG